MIDLIGDVHGHATELKMLLEKLGYTKQNGVYQHPERTAIFVGDYIDRGPEIKAVLEIVKGMADHGKAIALMGNHEFNALCFNRKAPGGNSLRPHSPKNLRQHRQTLRQFRNNKEACEHYLAWFKTLPLFYEGNGFRAVHACWDHDHINYLKARLDNHCLNEELLQEAGQKNTELFRAIDDTLTGKEITLPEGYHFYDKDENKRDEIRIRWWEAPGTMTYRSISVHPIAELPEQLVDVSALNTTTYYTREEPPVFFGHYWLEEDPFLYRPNVCCLDYSVAKGGKLVAYSFDGEAEMEKGKLTYVDCHQKPTT